MDGNCVFCDRTKFEERLIGETKNFWLIATLGQISDGGYTLLVPKRHVICLGAMREQEIREFETIIARVCFAVPREYGVVSGMIFEHGIVGQTIKHAHLHLLPGALSIAERICGDFPVSEIMTICFWDELRSLYIQRQEPYLLWVDFGGEIKVCWNPAAPAQYLRIVVAQAMNRPERANWRTMDPELDKKLWTETVSRLKSYF